MKWVDVQRQQFRRLGVLGRLGQPLPDPRPALRGRHPRRSGRPARRGLRLPPAQADPLVHDRPHRPGRGRAGVPGRDDAQHLRQLSRWSRACPRLDQSDGEGPDWHAMIWTTTPWTLPGQRGDRRPPRSGLRRRSLRRSGLRARPSARSWPPTWSPRSWRMGKITEFAEVGRCRGKELEHSRVSPPVRRSGQPDRAGRLRQRRGRHGLRPHRPRPRRRGLPDRPSLPAFRRSARSMPSGRFTDEAPDWLRRPAGLRGQSRDRRAPEGVGPSLSRDAAGRTATRTAGGARSR